MTSLVPSNEAFGLGPAAAPLAALYGAGVLLRRWMYDFGFRKIHTAPLPVISVGGLEVGGSGKTPVTAWVLQTLLKASHRPGLLTRGYGRQAQGLELRLRGSSADPTRLGDEPAMLAQQFDIHVAACAQRVVGSGALAATGECDVLVMDDGFSHRPLHRDVDIVVLRGEAPLGRPHFLPWGSLREPPSSLRRAQVLWIHWRPQLSSFDHHGHLLEGWLRYAPHTLPVLSCAVPSVLSGPTEFSDWQGIPVIAAAGIARPRDFERSVVTTGAQLKQFFPYADHHRFTERDVERLQQQLKQFDAQALVVTAKDAVKLRTFNCPFPLWILGTEVRVLHNEASCRELLLRQKFGATSASIAR